MDAKKRAELVTLASRSPKVIVVCHSQLLPNLVKVSRQKAGTQSNKQKYFQTEQLN